MPNKKGDFFPNFCGLLRKSELVPLIKLIDKKKHFSSKLFFHMYFSMNGNSQTSKTLIHSRLRNCQALLQTPPTNKPQLKPRLNYILANLNIFLPSKQQAPDSDR